MSRERRERKKSVGDGCDDAMARDMDEATPFLYTFVPGPGGKRVMKKIPNPDYVQTPRPPRPAPR